MELAAFSDRGIGTRERLEDYAADRIIETAGGLALQIALVCDGAGGGEAGELAARLTARTILEYLEISTETSIPQLLIKAVEQANKAVYNELRGTGTGTVALAAVHLNDESAPYGRLYIAHVGNSRIYLMREGRLVRLNIDHTLANEYVYAGQMSFEEARQLEAADYVTRSIGIGAEVNVDIGFYAERGRDFVNSRRAFRIGQKGMKLQEGDTVFTASDGLFPYVSEEEFLKHALDDNVERAARTLMKYAADRGPEDNISLSLVFVPSRNRRMVRTFERFSSRQRAGIAVFLLAVAMLIGILGLRVAGGESERTAFLVTQTFVQQLILEASYTPTPLPSPTPTRPFITGMVGDRYTQSGLSFPVFSGRYIDPLQPDEINYISIAGANALSGGTDISRANFYLQPGSSLRLNEVLDTPGSEQIDLILKRGSNIFINPGAFGSGGILVGLEQNPEIRMQSQNACMSIRQISADFSDPNDTDKVEVTCYGGNCTYRLPNAEPEVIPSGQQTLLNVDNPQLISTSPVNPEVVKAYAETIYQLAPLQLRRDQLNCLSPWLDDDGDGVNYPIDLCPNEAAPGSNDGCPGLDFDDDGVFGSADICPDLPGPPENDGCPTEGPAATQRGIVLTQMAIAQKSATPTLTPTPTLTLTPTPTPTETPIPLPEARDDEYAVLGNEILSIPAPGVLANDILNEAILAPLNDVTARGGTISLRGDGSFTYTPPETFVGLDTFSYTLTGVNGSDSARVTIDVLKPPAEPPVAAFTVSPTSGTAPLTVTILDASTGPINSYLWNFGDGSPLSLSSMPGVHTYNTAGTYTISLTVSGPGGESSASQDVTVFAPPLAVDDAVTLDEDTSTSINVLANDVYVNKPALTAVIISGPQHGTLVPIGGGVFTYTPAPNYFGVDSFTYQAQDGSIISNTATVSIAVNPVNDPPVAQNDVYNTPAQTTLNVGPPGVLANDSDIDTPLSALSVSLVGAPPPGNLALNSSGTGSFTYIPPSNLRGTFVEFTYQISDAPGSFDTAIVRINIGPNTPPNAVDDVYSVSKGAAAITLNVLQNDTDANGDTLNITSNTPLNPNVGTLNRTGNNITYDPPNNISSDTTVTFTYTISDGFGGTATATVTINVKNVNRAPVACSDIPNPPGTCSGVTYTTPLDTPLTVPAAQGVLANDSDPDGDPLTAILVSGATTTQGGTIALNPNGSFTYTPPSAVFNGNDTFTYRASDGERLSNIVTVRIAVAAKVARDDSYTTPEDTTLHVPGTGGLPLVLSNDTDVNGDPMTAAQVGGPATAAGGSVTLNADGSFIYAPPAGFNGTDSFQYRFSSGMPAVNSNIATVTITVNGTNTAPVANDDSYTTAVDTTLDVPGTGGLPVVLSNDTDINGSPLTVTLVNDVSNGTLTFNADGSFSYTPLAGFTGTDTFTYQANDGALDSNIATVTIFVDIGGNSPPTAFDDFYTAGFNSTLAVPGPGSLPLVIDNDSDPDGDTLTAVLFSGSITFQGGVVTLNADGSFTYTPPFGFLGTDVFIYQVTDGTFYSNPAYVIIDVSFIGNTPPVANDDFYITPVNTPLTVPGTGGLPLLLSNDTDINGDVLTSSLVGSGITTQGGTVFFPNANGEFVYTPPFGFTGLDTFTYQVNDGNGGTDTAVVTIEVGILTAIDDSYATNQDVQLVMGAPGVLANDLNPGGNPLVAILVIPPLNGALTLNSDGSFIYDPSPGFSGLDTFTYGVTDGFSYDEALVTITVNSSGSAAPFANDDIFTTAVDTPLNTGAQSVLDNDIDIDSPTLTAVLVGGATTTQGGTVTLNPDGSFDYTPPAGFTGLDTFQYQANDGTSNSNVATVFIDVGGVGVNLPPVVNDDVYTTTASRTLTVNAPGVLANDTDANGDALTAILVSDVSNGTLTFNADGSFTYQANARFRGIDTFTYRANDGAQNSATTATVSIAVSVPPPTPVAIELPAPPPATRCTDTNFENPGIIRSNFLDDEDRANLFCRLIAAGGSYMFWYGSPLTHAGNIGNQSVLDLGLIAAVDVFSMSGVTRFVNDVNICLQGSGYIIYMNVGGAPRVPQLWNAWTTPSFPGYTCTTLYAPGTVILVANKPG
jgi:serine/threonine protein phosphatase PrpC/PKD repeat protein